MDYLWAAVLGIVQGVTEFLPVSSSGHLAAMQELMGMEGPRLLMNVALHAGTLGSILAVYWPDLVSLARGSIRALEAMAKRDASHGQTAREDRASLWTVVGVGLATVVTAPLALVLEGHVEHMSHDLWSVGGFLLITALLLAGTRVLSRGSSDVGVPAALLIGAAQGLAVFPGISRSGSTIVVALLMGVRTEEAVRFSFLAALPALAGAMVLEGGMSAAELAARWPVYLAGAVVAFMVGWVCLKLLIRMTARRRLHLFALYLVPAGLALMWVGR